MRVLVAEAHRQFPGAAIVYMQRVGKGLWASRAWPRNDSLCHAEWRIDTTLWRVQTSIEMASDAIVAAVVAAAVAVVVVVIAIRSL